MKDNPFDHSRPTLLEDKAYVAASDMTQFAASCGAVKQIERNLAATALSPLFTPPLTISLDISKAGISEIARGR